MTTSRRRALPAVPLTTTLAAVIAAATLLICGCGSSDGSNSSTASGSPPTGPSPAATFTNADWYKASGNPDGFKDAPVMLTGKVFTEPEYDVDGVAFQMWVDPQRSEGNVVVWLSDPGVELRTDDYVRVTGAIGGAFEGENMMGGEVTATTVQASAVEKIDALAAAPPAAETVNPNKSASQFGVTVTVRKVEFADSETRVLVAFSNKSNAKVSIYAYSAKAIQAGRAYSPEMGLQGYPEPESELPRGSRTSGVIVFKPMKPGKTVRFVFEGYLDDWTKTLKPFAIVVK